MEINVSRMTQKAPGTLRTFKGHGVGNLRDRVSGRPASLLKFQSLKS